MRRYNVELSDRFKREFRKLDKYTQKICSIEDERLVILALTVGHRIEINKL